MNKTQFVRELQRELGDGVTPRQAERALDAVLDTIARSVLRRSLVKFRGFGSFSIKRRRARVVRHPENGSKLFVHESSTMKFRPSSRLWKKWEKRPGSPAILPLTSLSGAGINGQGRGGRAPARKK